MKIDVARRNQILTKLKKDQTKDALMIALSALEVLNYQCQTSDPDYYRNNINSDLIEKILNLDLEFDSKTS